LALLLAGSLTAMANGQGYRNSRMLLSGGGAWLASASQGIVTLIDGASEQVVGSVRAPGAQRGDAFNVVQSGTSAYVVNRTQGTVARVDGGTYEVSDPVRFGDGGNAALDVFAGSKALYIVDGGRRVASVTDPVTLKVRDRLSMAAQPGPDQSVVDSAGRLWVVDRNKGGLTWFDQRKRVHPEVGDAASRLVLVQGRPVLVDAARSRLGALTGDGAVDSWSCLEVRDGDKARLLGSTSSARVFAAVPASGTLVANAVGRDDCELSVEVGKPGDDFGPLVETNGYVFVPNRTSGRTLVVDTAAGRVAASLDVVKPGSRLELLAKDGFVFYNDVDGDRAGVIRLDGGQWKLGRALKKYEAGKAGDGILTGAGEDAKPQQPATNVPGSPPQSRPDTANKPVPPRPDPASADLPLPPDPGGGNPPPPTGGDPPPTGGDPPPGGGSADPPVITAITWAPQTVVRGKRVDFSATVTNADGATWAWTVSGTGGKTVAASAQPNGFTYNHKAADGNTLTVKLELTGTNGAKASKTETVATTADPQPQLTTPQATDATPGLGQPVTFTAQEPVGGAAGTWVWTVTGPGGTVVAGPTQQPGLAPFEYKGWNTVGTYTVTVKATVNGLSDTKSAPVTVVDNCKMAISAGTVDLRATKSGSVSVRFDNCFVEKWATAGSDRSWLTVGPGSFPVAPGVPATVTVTDTGNGGEDGSNMAAFHLSSGSSHFDLSAQVNRAPVWLNYTVCVPDTGEGVQFLASYQDANLSGLDVALTVAGRTIKLQSGGKEPTLFYGFLPRASLPSTETSWTVQATDEYGARSVRATGTDQWNCW
jgi:hypothetical protein